MSGSLLIVGTGRRRITRRSVQAVCNQGDQPCCEPLEGAVAVWWADLSARIRKHLNIAWIQRPGTLQSPCGEYLQSSFDDGQQLFGVAPTDDYYNRAVPPYATWSPAELFDFTAKTIDWIDHFGVARQLVVEPVDDDDILLPVHVTASGVIASGRALRYLCPAASAGPQDDTQVCWTEPCCDSRLWHQVCETVSERAITFRPHTEVWLAEGVADTYLNRRAASIAGTLAYGEARLTVRIAGSFSPSTVAAWTQADLAALVREGRVTADGSVSVVSVVDDKFKRRDEFDAGAWSGGLALTTGAASPDDQIALSTAPTAREGWYRVFKEEYDTEVECQYGSEGFDDYTYYPALSTPAFGAVGIA